MDTPLNRIKPSAAELVRRAQQTTKGALVSKPHKPKAVHPEAAPQGGGNIDSTAQVDPEAFVDPSAFVGPRVIIERGCHVGPRVRLEEASHLHEETGIGADTIIGAWTHVHQGTGIGSHCNIGPRNSIESHVGIGNYVTTGKGAVFALGLEVGDGNKFDNYKIAFLPNLSTNETP